MTTSQLKGLTSGIGWTIASSVGSQILRLILNLVLTRLLVPEAFGFMLIINTLRVGLELLSDVGISQSIVISPRGEDRQFYNTAWTLAIIRGLLLALFCAALAIPISRIYGIEDLVAAILISSLGFAISGFASTSVATSQRRMLFKKRVAYDFSAEVIGAVGQVVLVFVFRSQWALVYGLLWSVLAKVALSYCLLPDIRNRLAFDRDSAKELIRFGKWLLISSGVMFFAMQYDRIYLPLELPLTALGVYAIARSLSEVYVQTSNRVCNSVLFPVLAREYLETNPDHTKKFDRRFVWLSYLLACYAACLSGGADFIVAVLFDSRYADAGWMLSFLAIGSWFSVLTSFSDVQFTAIRRPIFIAIANTTRLALLVAGLPIAFYFGSLQLALITMILIEFFRYSTTVVLRANLGLPWIHELGASAILLLTVALIALARLTLEFSAWPALQ